MEVCLRSLQRLRARPAVPPPSPPCVCAPQSVQTFGRKKTAVAVSYCKKGRGLIKINGCPIELVEPEILRFKVFEPILLLGRDRFANVDIRIRVKGGGYTAQIYGASSHAAPCMRVRCRCLQRGRGPGGACVRLTRAGSCLAAIRQALAKAIVAYYQKCALRRSPGRASGRGGGAARVSPCAAARSRRRRLFTAHAP